MKKLFFICFLILVLVGCSKSPKTTDEQYLPVRIYIMQESGEPLKPSVSLEDSNKFTFTYSALSSYIAIGSYEVDDGNLVLKTDDGKFKYVFKIRNNALFFNAKESSQIPSFANVLDGAIFE